MACLAWVTGHRGVFTISGHATALPWAHGYARLLACHLEGNKAVHASRRSVGNSLAWPHHNAGIWPFQLGSGQERSEEHTSELQSRENVVCRLLLETKKNNQN